MGMANADRHEGAGWQGSFDPLRQLFGADDSEPISEIPGATQWQDIASSDAITEWADLRSWVELLQARFSHLNHHIIPRCWWRHNEHVEALVALRDHERSSFSDSAPATAALDWFRALRDVTALLRAWTAECSCGADHREEPTRWPKSDPAEWESFVRSDVEHRLERETELSTRKGSTGIAAVEPAHSLDAPAPSL
jgi:hypothetical protein